MQTQVADGVLVRESAFLQSNTVAVVGTDGVLLVDPGVTRAELAALAEELGATGQPVVAAFSTHPHWDHVLWHADLGGAVRYASAVGAATIRELLSRADAAAAIGSGFPPEFADDIPMELLGLVEGLPEGAVEVPWPGPVVRILEHRAHSPGHAALLVRDSRLLVAGDMLSDVLIPFLDLRADDPIGDYLAALDLFDGVADEVDVVVPGHGSVGGASDLRERIERDRAYVEALWNGETIDDPRIGPDAPYPWMRDVHEGQRARLAEKARSSPHREEPLS